MRTPWKSNNTIDDLCHIRAHERKQLRLTPSPLYILHMIFIYLLTTIYKKITEDIVIYGFGMEIRMYRTRVSKPSSYRTYPVVGLPSISDSRSSIFRRKESL